MRCICGADGPPVTEAVKAKIAANQCPFCSTVLPAGKEDAKMMARLMELDATLTREKKILDSKIHAGNQLTRNVKRSKSAMPSKRNSRISRRKIVPS